MPPTGEPDAVRFYEGLLGIPQVSKPAHIATRGGCWFERGELKVHLGVDADFRPARKGHPAFVIEGLGDLLITLRASRLAERGVGEEGVSQGSYRGWS